MNILNNTYRILYDCQPLTNNVDLLNTYSDCDTYFNTGVKPIPNIDFASFNIIQNIGYLNTNYYEGDVVLVIVIKKAVEPTIVGNLDPSDRTIDV